MSLSTTPGKTIKCDRRNCGAEYSDEEFLAAHPGRFSHVALREAKKGGKIMNCGSCPDPVIAKTRPCIDRRCALQWKHRGDHVYRALPSRRDAPR